MFISILSSVLFLSFFLCSFSVACFCGMFHDMFPWHVYIPRFPVHGGSQLGSLLAVMVQ